MSELSRRVQLGVHLEEMSLGVSSGVLQKIFGVSKSTLIRDIEWLRRWGCQIESLSDGALYRYRLNNGPQVKKRLELLDRILSEETLCVKSGGAS